MFTSVTRLRVRSLRYLPAFLWMTYLTQRQVKRASGFRGGRLLIDARWTFWTVTVWEDDRAMKAYRGAQAHGRAMPWLAEWCDEAAYAHWTQEGDTLASWPEAHERLVIDGKLSRVSHPSPDHESRLFPPPRLKPLIGNDLRPSR
jgi:hypothetical protein